MTNSKVLDFEDMQIYWWYLYVCAERKREHKGLPGIASGWREMGVCWW